MSGLRILHVDPERGWGGGEEQVLGLVRHLSGVGHRVVLAAEPGGSLARAVAGTPVDVRPLPIRNAFDLGAARILRALAEEADIVHFHTARAHAMALWLGRGGAPRVVTRRMDYPPRPRPYVRILYNRCVDRVVAISRWIQGVLIEAGVKPNRLTVIPSGVDVNRFASSDTGREEMRRSEWDVGPDDPVVLVVGGLVRRKGHAVLLDAARRLVDRGMSVRYAICGDGNRRQELQRQVERLHLAPWVRFMGWRVDIPRLLGAADVLVLPSLHEGLGVAALEAMAAGCPVVASRTGGLTEAVADGETGWLVEPGDVQALADAVEAAVRDPARRVRFGRAGRERVAQKFSMERMAMGNERLYRTVLEAAGR